MVTISSADTFPALYFIRSESMFFLYGPAVGKSRSFFWLNSFIVMESSGSGPFVDVPHARTSLITLKSAMMDSLRESRLSRALLFSCTLSSSAETSSRRLSAFLPSRSSSLLILSSSSFSSFILSSFWTRRSSMSSLNWVSRSFSRFSCLLLIFVISSSCSFLTFSM